MDPERLRQRISALRRQLDAEALPASWIAADLAAKLKFAECLPEEVALEVAAARVSDPDGVRRVLGSRWRGYRHCLNSQAVPARCTSARRAELLADALGL